MAEVKREIRSIGQRISGLSAGDQFTFVLKRPKPRVDAGNARQATRMAQDQVATAQKAVAELTAARSAASQGSLDGAQQGLDRARALFDSLQGGIQRARDYAERAAEDLSGAPAEVKDAYQAAKDSADLGVQHAEKVAAGFDEALRAVGAFIQEAASRG